MALDGWILMTILGACVAVAFGADPRHPVRIRGHHRTGDRR